MKPKENKCSICGKELVYKEIDWKDYQGKKKVKTWMCPDKCIIYRYDKFGEILDDLMYEGEVWYP